MMNRRRCCWSVSGRTSRPRISHEYTNLDVGEDRPFVYSWSDFVDGLVQVDGSAQGRLL